MSQLGTKAIIIPTTTRSPTVHGHLNREQLLRWNLFLPWSIGLIATCKDVPGERSLEDSWEAKYLPSST